MDADVPSRCPVLNPNQEHERYSPSSSLGVDNVVANTLHMGRGMLTAEGPLSEDSQLCAFVGDASAKFETRMSKPTNTCC